VYSNFKQRLPSGLAALFRALFDRTVDVQADRELYLLEDRLRHQITISRPLLVGAGTLESFWFNS
jgi:hypothetical protein